MKRAMKLGLNLNPEPIACCRCSRAAMLPNSCDMREATVALVGQGWSYLHPHWYCAPCAIQQLKVSAHDPIA